VLVIAEEHHGGPCARGAFVAANNGTLLKNGATVAIAGDVQAEAER